MVRSSALKLARTSDSDVPEAEGDQDPPTFSQSQSPAAQTLTHSRPREPPPLERAVVSRTRFNISLPTPSPLPGAGKTSLGSEADQRGWSSPHGEPYRPLGRPELNLKFSPHLVHGVSPMLQNSQRMRVVEGGGGFGNGATGAGASSEKYKEVREASSTSNVGASIVTLVDQFVTSMTNRKRHSDERQLKLAHRLQANVDGFSPGRVRGLHRCKPFALEFAGDEPQHYHQTLLHGDASLLLLREAIEEGTRRLRSTRNGSNFLHLPPPEFHGLHELHEQYLRSRTIAPQPLMSNGSNNGGPRTSPRILVGSKTSPRNTTHFHRDESVDYFDGDDGQTTWYLPYTTRQLQRSPHCRLPSLEEFRVRVRDEKEPLRPLRASSNTKAQSFSRRLRVSRASVSSTRSSMAPNIAGGDNSDDTSQPNAPALGKGAFSPLVMTIASSSLPPSAPPLHSIEKLQATIDTLEATKRQQSARLATTLEMIAQDRCECLTNKFRSLRVRSEAVEDLKRMREHSERNREERVLAVVSKTAVWYPELLRRLLAREGTPNVNSGVQLPLHAAELFIVQAVRRLTNDGCEFQSAQLFEVLLLLHRDDLELLQVQQLLEYLRNALHINHEEWIQYFAEHGLPEPTDIFADDRKDPQNSADGKTSFTAASTVRVAASMGKCRQIQSRRR
ncbi:hypothetical protein PPTG_24289 [Phytophthora nicotianae INRA-310]|uniref:Uncharacterized protein n=1 Tax=Phytophthora nicotianae (strain INRA-310) TaxID=761204 RepID=W2PHN0_PHYN3|nr:hypothetical protein PPTG_24289 [Phytophthora nicotianae INRA-310]ETN00357.1 hypothetical protein PPTG_24289 [Phytophthora nicotianae INRA-310]